MLLSSEDSICIESGILLSSGPSTCLNSNKLFLFKNNYDVEGYRCWEMCFWYDFSGPTGCTPPKNLAQPYFANWRCFLHRGKSRNRWIFSKIKILRFLQNYDDYNCISGIKLKGYHYLSFEGPCSEIKMCWL